MKRGLFQKSQQKTGKKIVKNFDEKFCEGFA
jgi:hypothetical protein